MFLKGTLRRRSPKDSPPPPISALTGLATAPTNNQADNYPALAGCQGGNENEMEMIGAGLAALGVIGPGIGVGILTGLSTSAIGRNPDAAAQIRATFIIGAAFAEGLGVLAVVVGLLVIFIGGA